MAQAPAPEATISPSQHRRLEAMIASSGLDRERIKSWLLRAWGVEHLTEVPQSRLSALERRLSVWTEQVADEKELADERAAIQTEGMPLKPGPRFERRGLHGEWSEW